MTVRASMDTSVKSVLHQLTGSFKFPTLYHKEAVNEIHLALTAKNNEDIYLQMENHRSLCYHVGISTANLAGFAMVICPSKTEVKAQVDFLSSKGLIAAAVYEGMSHDEEKALVDRCGDLRFLYVTSRMTPSQELVKLVEKIGPLIAVVVEVADCVSDYSVHKHTHRSYRSLWQLKRSLKVVWIFSSKPTNPMARRDLYKLMELRIPVVSVSVPLCGSPFYELLSRDDFEEAAQNLWRFIKKMKNGVVYCNKDSRLPSRLFTVKQNLYILRQNKTDEDVSDLQRGIVDVLFSSEPIQSSDTDFVVFWNLPESRNVVDRFSRKSTHCRIYCSMEDLNSEFTAGEDHKANYKNYRLQELLEFCENRKCRRYMISRYFGIEYFIPERCCDICASGSGSGQDLFRRSSIYEKSVKDWQSKQIDAELNQRPFPAFDEGLRPRFVAEIGDLLQLIENDRGKGAEIEAEIYRSCGRSESTYRTNCMLAIHRLRKRLRDDERQRREDARVAEEVVLDLVMTVVSFVTECSSLASGRKRTSGEEGGCKEKATKPEKEVVNNLSAISEVVVDILNPLYVSGRFASKELFKKLAKQLSQQMIATQPCSITELQAEVKQITRSVFRRLRKVETESDLEEFTKYHV
ncbi:hypothetical protein ACOME3_010511 [Neoechinorhynchus agilis]